MSLDSNQQRLMSEEQNSSCIHLALFQALSQQRCGGGRDGTAEISKLWGPCPAGAQGFMRGLRTWDLDSQ